MYEEVKMVLDKVIEQVKADGCIGCAFITTKYDINRL